jgi:HK97 family phage prohead protease
MAEWDAKYISDLPDTAFLLVEPGGHKDREGKTVPRSLRHFPVHNASGGIDVPHLKNALARIPQASSLSASQRESAMGRAKALARKTTVSGPVGTYEGAAGSGRSKPQAGPDELPLPAHIETRAFELAALEVRSDGMGRTLVGRAVPYNRVASLGAQRRERFIYGAFTRQVRSGQAHRAKMYESHRARLAGDFPIGKTLDLEERSDGLWGVWRLLDSQRADAALEVVRDNLVTGLSVGFSSPEGGTIRTRDGVEEVRLAHLDHVCLTDVPVYEEAAVLAIRDQADAQAGPDPLEQWLRDKGLDGKGSLDQKVARATMRS